MYKELPLLRTSERSVFKRCQFAHDLSYTRTLKSTGTEAPALRFGSLIHKSLELFYRPGMKRGPKPANSFQKLYMKDLKEAEKSFGMKVEDEWMDAGELGISMMEHYYDVYGKDQRFKVVATEQPFKVPIRSSKGNVLFYYVGTVDGIWYDREKKQLLIVDHKTAKSIDALINALPQDDQAGSYWTFGVDWIYAKGILKPNQKLNGLLYNIMRKAKPDARPRNSDGHCLNKPSKKALVAEYERIGKKLPKPGGVDDLISDLGKKALQLGEVSKDQPIAYFDRHTEWRSEGNRTVMLQRTKDEAKQIVRIRRGEQAILKSPSPMNCNGCAFRGPCELHEAGQEWELMLDAAYTQWEPYSAHEIYNRN